MKDFRGLPVTASSQKTVDSINDFVVGMLGYEASAAAIVEAAQNDPESTLANAYAAIFCMFLESPEAPGVAAGFIDRAEAASKNATERERMVLESTKAWAASDTQRAIALCEDIATRYPGELVTAKTCHYHYFNRGDATGMLRLSQKTTDTNADLAYIHGMAAFAFEQAHMMKEAEAAAHRAMAIKRKEPWAQHALAHVYLTQGRTTEARHFLEDVKETWTGLNSVMFTHNHWHLALVLIDQGDTDAALAYYDNAIWGVWKEYSQDQIGAVSLLARLELAGVDVGDRWADVGEYLKVRVNDNVQPNLTVQYLYGLARADRPEADTLMENMRAFSAEFPSFTRSTWQEVAVPLCEGLLAHARGDYETTVHKIGSILSRLVEIGGSHAQRDLFDQIWLDALIRTNRLAAAQNILGQRLLASPEAKPTAAKLAVIYDRLELPTEAARMRAGFREAVLSH